MIYVIEGFVIAIAKIFVGIFLFDVCVALFLWLPLHMLDVLPNTQFDSFAFALSGLGILGIAVVSARRII